MKQDYKYIVRVSCLTYNHAAYIEDALNGFCMQETTFPFVCTIFDDDSTDGQPEVIKNYLNEHFDLENEAVTRYEETDDYKLTFTQHKTNKNCYFAVFFLKYNHYSLNKSRKPYLEGRGYEAKYIALCEGDDYWIDPNKLHKQVDCLDNNPGMFLCFTANTRLLANGEGKENRMLSENCKSCSFEDYIVSEYDNIDTCTMMYITSLLSTLPEWCYKVGVGDIPCKLILFSKGNVGYINDITACYRIGAASSWSLKMKNSRKMRYNNQKRIFQMWKDFDVWTEKKYHKFIVKKIFVLYKRYVKSEIVLFVYSMKRIFSNGK